MNLQIVVQKKFKLNSYILKYNGIYAILKMILGVK